MYEINQIVKITKAHGPAVAKITAVEGDVVRAQLGGWNAETKTFGYGGFAFDYTLDGIAPASPEDVEIAAEWAGRHLSWREAPLKPATNMPPDDDWLRLDEDGVLIN